MLEYTFGGIRCKISLLFPAVLLCLLFADPSGYALGGFAAALLHECGHVIATCLLRLPPKEIVISCFGIRMMFPDSIPNAWASVIIAAAGPLVNAVFAVVLYCCVGDTVGTAIHIVLAVMNILPVMPLDGAVILQGVLSLLRISEITQYRMMNGIFFVVWIPLAVLGILLSLHEGYNITLLLVVAYLLYLKLFYKWN